MGSPNVGTQHNALSGISEHSRDGGKSPSPRRLPRVTRAHDRALRAGYTSTWISEEQLARLPEPVWPALEIVAMALEIKGVKRAARR